MNLPATPSRFRLTLNGTLALWREWSSPSLNPFLGQSRRKDARSARWVFTLIFIVIIWLAAMGAALAWASEVDVC